MKPLNNKERTKAFYKVFGLFLICFVLAMILGFSTMNLNKVMDYTSRKQLEGLKNDLTFQQKIFQPNIDNATKRLKDLPGYKEKRLDLNVTKSDIETSLKKIMSEWKPDEKNPQYIMYKNIVDIYFALESATDDKFKLEDQLSAKENVVINGTGDMQRIKDMRDALSQENQSLKTEKASLNNNVITLQELVTKMQTQLSKCRDSLRSCIDINKGYKQQLNKAK
jgi:chromosome segregation ATPase